MRHALLTLLKSIRRTIYKIRILIPGLRERHLMEAMVGPLGFWDELQRYQLNVLKQMGLQPRHALLDIGCGPLQGGIGFIDYLLPCNYVGIDRKKEAIDLAHRIIGAGGLSDKNPVLLVSDSLGELELNGWRFDFIWASQMLYYLTTEELRRLYSVISRHLKPEGVFLGDIIGPEHYEYTNPRHGWFLHSPESMNAASLPFDLHASVLGKIAEFGYPRTLSLHTNRLIKLQHIPYFTCQKKFANRDIELRRVTKAGQDAAASGPFK